MRRPWVALVGTLLTALTFAGCIGDDAAPEADAPVETEACVAENVCGAKAVLDEAGRDLRTQLTAEDTLEVPQWEVGDVFEQHLYYGSADTSGEHIVTMVTNIVDGDCYQLGTTSQQAARTDVVFDLPILGCIGQEQLETTALGVDWSWMYQFPLSDGKTWDGSVDGLFNWNRNSFHSYEFTITVAYDAAIDTPRGNFPGFWITGTLEDGSVLLYYNYVPAVGWFSHFWMYDLSTDAPDDIMFHAMSMGTSKGYSGKYYIDTAEAVIDSFMFPPVVFGETDPYVQSFVVPDDATYLKGVVVPIACPGMAEVRLMDPANAITTYTHNYEGDPQACAEGGEDGNPDPAQYTVSWYDEAADAGEWRVVATGAGLYGAYVWLMAVVENEYTLEGVSDAAAGAHAGH